MIQISTDFAIFQYNEEGDFFEKIYLPQYTFLSQTDFQNSRNFGNESPFFIPQNLPGQYPKKDLKTLSDWLKINIKTDDFNDNCFKIAQNLIFSLQKIHQRKLIFGSLSSNTILIDSDLNVWFSEWSQIANNQAKVFDENIFLESQLVSYLATELTYQQKAKFDFKTDLYALGVVLYEIFTQNNPFSSKNPLDTIYKHRTLVSQNPSVINPKIGQGIGQVILKLLEKNPENRFNSIEFCLDSFQNAFRFFKENRLEERILIEEKKTFSIHANLLQHFDTQLYQLEEFYQESQQKKIGSVCFIEGKNGIEKSHFIDQFFIKNESSDTLLLTISLKNDQNTPLASFREMLKMVCNYYLTRPNDELINFKNICYSRLGLALGVLHEIYPAIAQILPSKTEIPTAKGLDLKSQLIFALAEFLKAFIESEKKILLHFRGFHFTPNNTFGILEGIFKELPLEKLFFIFTYEADLLEKNQVEFIENQLANQPNLLKFRQLDLKALTENELAEILKQAKIKDAASVSGILFAKTNGLSNFINRAIDELSEKEKIRFDTEKDSWYFEKEALLTVNNYSGNLSEFYQKTWQNLSKPIQKILFSAAVLGENFEKTMLENIIDQTDFEANFQQILNENIIKSNSVTNDYSFVDIDFRKTYLNAFPQAEIDQQNQQIVETYLRIYPKIEKTEQFYIFLYKILQLPQNQLKKYEKWIEIGAVSALNIADFDLARRCYQVITNMISEEDWQQNQDKYFKITAQYMSVCSLCLKLDEAEEIYQKLKKTSKNEQQLLYIIFLFGEVLFVKHDFKGSIELSIETFKKFGISVSPDPSLLRIIYSSIRMNRLMKGKDFEFFKNLPPVQDEATIYKTRMLQSIIGSAFIVNPKMIPELIYKQTDFVIKTGFSYSLSMGLGCYAFMVANYQKNYKSSEYYFDIAQKINEITKDSLTYELNNFLFASFLLPWFGSFRAGAKQLIDNFQHCRQAGYLYVANWNINMLSYHLMFGENSVAQMREIISEVLPFIHANSPANASDLLNIIKRYCDELSNETDESLGVVNQRYRWENLVSRIIDGENPVNQVFLTNYNFFMNFMKGNYEVNKKDVILCKKSFLASGKGYFAVQMNYYYVSLNYAKNGRKLDTFEADYIKTAIKELYEVAKINEQNFITYAVFLDALYDLKNNRVNEANLKLQKAYESALKYNLLLSAGLIARELGELYEKLSIPSQSLDYFRLAYENFNRFGAKLLAEPISEKYPVISEKNSEYQSLNISQKIDIQSFIKASTSISAEIKLEGLLEKMMVVLVENAGAENVFFIVPDVSGFQLIASKTKVGIDNSQHILLDEKTSPISILHYVMRSHESVLLENASQNTIYKNDFYIKNNAILSVLCLPVIKNKQLIGIIYLENNLIPNAFSNENTNSLALLASQIAISFENSQLYDNLENKVRERTNELMIEKDKSEKLLLNILPSEVANELKELGHSEARLYNHVTVLFADFVGFTRLSEKLTPKELIDEVDEYFKAFDMIMEEFGLEKIKTIGDAYLSVCGLPNAVENHAHQAAKASKAIMSFIENHHLTKKNASIIDFDIRIGLHSGSVIAGIVGLKKFAYDIWGDTVNTAARMEQSCEPNKINISSSTYELIKDEFTCQYRGKIEAKNKGEIDMYYLE